MKLVSVAVAAVLLVACGDTSDDEVAVESRSSTDTTTADTVAPSATDSAETSAATIPAATTETTPSPETSGPADDPATAGSRDEYVDALATGLIGDPDFPVAEDEAECLAGSLVDAIGMETFEAAGASPSDLAAAEDFAEVGVELPADFEDRAAGAIVDCIDIPRVAREGLARSTGLPTESLECVTDDIDVEALGALLATALVDTTGARESGQSFGEQLVVGLPPDCAKTFFLEVGAAGGDIDDQQRACLDENLPAADVKALFEAQLGTPDDIQSAVAAVRPVLVECGVDA